MASNSFRHAMGEKNDTGNVYFPHYTYGHRMVMARWGKKMTRAMCTFHTTLTDIAWSWRPFSEDLSMSLQDKQSNVNKTVVMLMLNHLVKKTRVRSHRYKQRKDASYRPDTENSDADSVSTVYSILPLVQPLPTKGKVSSSNEAGGKGATST
ncbi:uncharacterized protein [Littorina saxatilis]|uniref:uncharacterized protein n=1 Tax=Littorina saxatilis TaxID=31220 RepID=UPI0038B5244B